MPSVIRFSLFYFNKMNKWETNENIIQFRKYLRIPTVHPNVDYESCIRFLTEQATYLQLPYKVHYVGGNLKKPLLIISWLGSQPELPSILVNSHMDVVPVFENKWTYPPFGADIDAEGRIFARGSQDCKCVGMQYLAAIRSLKQFKPQNKRTLHIMFVPDEEIGGETGMQRFSRTKEFQDLNVGFAFDEGSATDDNKFVANYAERSIWQINFKFNGSAGHGSLLLENTAAEKLARFLNEILAFRNGELKRLKGNGSFKMGDVTSINLTMIKGGVQSNVVPPQLEACFDMRISIDVDLKQFEQLLNKWCIEAGGNIEWEWIFRCDAAPPTILDENNPYWNAIQRVFKKMDHILETQVYVGGSDIQFLREIGIPSIGFSPMNNTPTLMHNHDEYLSADVYLNGIQIYKEIFNEILNF